MPSETEGSPNYQTAVLGERAELEEQLVNSSESAAARRIVPDIVELADRSAIRPFVVSRSDQRIRRRDVAAADALSDERPVIFVVCPTFGQTSEVWLWRQVVGIEHYRVHVICWGRVNEDLYPVDDLPVHVLDFDRAPTDGRGRWLHRLRTLPELNFYGSVGSERQALIDLCRKYNPQAILGQYGYVALRMLPVAQTAQVPLIAQFNGLDISSLLAVRWYRWSLRRAVQKFRRMVVLADHMRDELLELGADRERIDVIPYGVPCDEFTPSHLVSAQPCRFLAVGRFTEKKAPLDTIRAFARCAGQEPGVTLRMIGDGPLEPAARELVSELGIDNSVEFLGTQSSTRVREELQSSGVFVQHSVVSSEGDMEGWPVAVAEAAACGIPIVSTKHASIPQQVLDGESGFLVEEHDWQGMGDAMLKLARSPELRRRFGARARAHMCEFTTDAATRRLEQSIATALPTGAAK